MDTHVIHITPRSLKERKSAYESNKLAKRLHRLVGQAIADFNMIGEGDKVMVDVCRLSSMFDASVGDLGIESSLRRWTLDTATGKAADDILETNDPGDLPTRDPRLVGRKHRYGYLVGSRENPNTVELGAGWKKIAKTGGREYISLKLDDPSFPAAIYANLIQTEATPETFTLIWSR